MKKNLSLLVSGLIFLFLGMVNGCKKDSEVPTHMGTATSFTEEFENVYQLKSKDWVIKDNTPQYNSDAYAEWSQGHQGYNKAGGWEGFSAYSSTTSVDEFAYSLVGFNSSPYSVSSWLISPVLSVKDGDQISFYTRADSAGNFTERMQVLMSKSASSDVGNRNNSAGAFTTVLLEINPAQSINGYPTRWTKYQYTFSGISGNKDTRIAFRHYVTNTSNAKGIGIDLFKFQVN